MVTSDRGQSLRVEVISADLDLLGDGRRVTLADLSPGMTLIYGPNESGKSTTRQLIAGGIFPYPRVRSNAKVRPPVLAIGLVCLSLGGRQVSVGSTAPETSGRTAEEREAFEVLSELRESVDRNLYRRLFCISYEDLLTSGDLVDDEIVNHLTGLSSAGDTARSVREALDHLEGDRSQIFRPRARSRGALNALLGREVDLARALRNARREIGTVTTKERALHDLEVELVAQEERARELETELADLVALQRYREQLQSLPQRPDNVSLLRLHLATLLERNLTAAFDSIKVVLQRFGTLQEEHSAREDLLRERARLQQSLPIAEVRERVVTLTRAPTLVVQWESLRDLGRELASAETLLSEARRDAGFAGPDLSIAQIRPLSREDLEMAERCDSEVLDAVRLQQTVEAELRQALDRGVGGESSQVESQLELDSLEESRRKVVARLALAQSFVGALESGRLVLSHVKERTGRDLDVERVRRGVVVTGVALLILAMLAGVLWTTRAVFAVVMVLALACAVCGVTVIWRGTSPRRRTEDRSERSADEAAALDAALTLKELGTMLGVEDPLSPQSEVVVRSLVANLSEERTRIDSRCGEIAAKQERYASLLERQSVAARGVDDAQRRRIELLASLGIERNEVTSARVLLECVREVSSLEARCDHLRAQVGSASDRLERGQVEARDLLRLRPGLGGLALQLLDPPGLVSELDGWIRSMDYASTTIENLTVQISNSERASNELEHELASLWVHLEELLATTLPERSAVRAELLHEELREELSFRDRLGASQAVLESERRRLGELFSPERISLVGPEPTRELQQRINECETEIARVRAVINASRQEAERVSGELTRLEASSLVALENEYEAVCVELRELTLDYLRMTSAAHMLQSAHARYELEVQPKVIARAAQLFHSFSAGRYGGIVLAAEREFEVEGVASAERPTGRKRVTELSLGTRNQLILALRLAYLEVIISPRYVLPIILDDVAVSTDESRLRAIFLTLLDLARSRQILYLTCHERERDLFFSLKNEFPDLPCSVIDLVDG